MGPFFSKLDLPCHTVQDGSKSKPITQNHTFILTSLPATQVLTFTSVFFKHGPQQARPLTLNSSVYNENKKQNNKNGSLSLFG